VDEKLYESLSSEGGNHSIIVHDGRVHRDGRTIYTNHSRLGFFFLNNLDLTLFTFFSENIFDSKAFLNFDQIFGMTQKKATYSSIFFGINWDECLIASRYVVFQVLSGWRLSARCEQSASVSGSG
jgi:hypothetical protein